MGVTVIVATIVVLVVFTTVNEGIFPEPLEANPILGVSFTQSNVVPATSLVKFLGGVIFPSHNLRLVGSSITGVG